MPKKWLNLPYVVQHRSKGFISLCTSRHQSTYITYTLASLNCFLSWVFLLGGRVFLVLGFFRVSFSFFLFLKEITRVIPSQFNDSVFWHFRKHWILNSWYMGYWQVNILCEFSKQDNIEILNYYINRANSAKISVPFLFKILIFEWRAISCFLFCSVLTTDDFEVQGDRKMKGQSIWKQPTCYASICLRDF